MILSDDMDNIRIIGVKMVKGMKHQVKIRCRFRKRYYAGDHLPVQLLTKSHCHEKLFAGNSLF
jgi:hypothetical protein